MKTIHITTLGCDKNAVDAQQMLGLLAQNGYTIEPNPKKAEIIVVNTCCFIQAAKEESIAYILEYAGYKAEGGQCQTLIVSGCMAERYYEELKEELPEVDGFLGVGHIDNILDLVADIEAGRKHTGRIGNIDREYIESIDRFIEDGTVTAYLKISEGCDHHCTYCVIPKIRGRHRSRKPEAIYKEAAYLKKRGVKELIIIAQDITQYGGDLDGEVTLAVLLQRLAEDFDFTWIRLLYMYPEGITDELLEVIASHDNICHYFDLPMQHTEDRILKRMGRQIDQASLFEIVGRIRQKLPDAVLRTAIITGFPGETEEDHQGLLASLEKLKIDRLGVFAYSQEENTPAAQMPDQIPEDIKEARRAEIYAKQADIMTARNQTFIGQTAMVLIEGLEENGQYTGRMYSDAPDVDCIVFVDGKGKALTVGSFYKVKILHTMDFDLIGEVENESTK